MLQTRLDYETVPVVYYLQPAINAVCRLEDKLRPLQLTDNERDILNQLKSHLDIFAKATQHLSGSSYPTLSMLFGFSYTIGGEN